MAFYREEGFVPYLEGRDELVPGGFALLGVPLDMTTCYHQGTGEGPRGIRQASDNLEDYCPVSDRSLLDRPFSDVGDVNFGAVDSIQERLDRVGESVSRLLGSHVRPLLLGGEHSISAPAIRSCLAVYPDLCVIQFDCHADLRPEYLGSVHSHASVMARVLEFLPAGRLFQVGIRSGTREEWTFMRQHDTVYPATEEAASRIRAKVGSRPVYITVDLDVLDSSVLPGTGTPEPGGISYSTMEALILDLASLRIVGADVMELAPPLDPSGVSSVVAAKVVRTILLNW
jgi:agmatinase